MQQNDRAVLHLVDQLLTETVGVVVVPVLHGQRPVEEGHAADLQHGLVCVAVGRADHIPRVEAERGVENLVRVAELVADLVLRELGQIGMVVGVAADLVSVLPRAPDDLRVVLRVHALHEEGDPRAALLQPVQQALGVLGRAVVKCEGDELFPLGGSAEGQQRRHHDHRQQHCQNTFFHG